MPLCLFKPHKAAQEAPESRLWHFGNKYPLGVVDAILERFWKLETLLKYFCRCCQFSVKLAYSLLAHARMRGYIRAASIILKITHKQMAILA